MYLKYNKLYLNFTTDYNIIILSFSLKVFVEFFNIKFYYTRRKHEKKSDIYYKDFKKNKDGISIHTSGLIGRRKA